MPSKKSLPKTPVVRSASRTTSARPKPRPQKNEVTTLREKLRRVERERDFFRKELTLRVAKEIGAGNIDDDELDKLRRSPSDVSIRAIIRELEAGAVS